MFLFNRESGIATWIFIVVITIALVGGGIALFQSGRNSAYDDISFEGLGENAITQEEVEENECITITSPQVGENISWPLQVTGFFDGSCWSSFEGEAGFAFIRHNGEIASEMSFVNISGGPHYQDPSSDFEFVATINGVTEGFYGDAELVIRERDDLGEDPSLYTPQEVAIPIVLNPAVVNQNQNNNDPMSSETMTLLMPVINGEGGIQNAENAGIALQDIPQSWRDQGLYIGCGVSVAWLPIEVSQTQGVLNATYEYLFAANPTITYQGETYSNLIGSYAQNPNYPMNYESVEINGTTARIYLTGTIMNNHCADPAIMAQLRFAATQFPTVDAIEIYLNGQLFDLQAWYSQQ